MVNTTSAGSPLPVILMFLIVCWYVNHSERFFKVTFRNYRYIISTTKASLAAIGVINQLRELWANHLVAGGFSAAPEANFFARHRGSSSHSYA